MFFDVFLTLPDEVSLKCLLEVALDVVCRDSLCTSGAQGRLSVSKHIMMYLDADSTISQRPTYIYL